MKASLITAVLLLLIAGCDRPQPTAQVVTPVFTPNTDSGGACGKTALTFARSLVNGDFVYAHEQLSQALKSSLSVEDLKESYDTMLADGAEILRAEPLGAWNAPEIKCLDRLYQGRLSLLRNTAEAGPAELTPR